MRRLDEVIRVENWIRLRFMLHNINSIHINAYLQIKEKLGEGSFGIVRKVESIEDGVIWACKAVNKEKVSDLEFKSMLRYVNKC